MLVEQVWTGNNYRNFNYLVACPDSGEALAIDPLDFNLCLSIARSRDWTITKVLNTHHHGDHTGGNKGIIAATGARLLAHKDAGEKIANIDQGLSAGDVIRLGKHTELECLDTPGHTMSHICLLSRSDTPALFSGDTLFNAGAGNCHNGGHPDALFETFERQLNKLASNTVLYPGHEYLENNLRFTLDREPDNRAAAALLADISNQDPSSARLTTLAEEMDINVFFRLDQPSVLEGLQRTFKDLGDSPSPLIAFRKLRELRNQW